MLEKRLKDLIDASQHLKHFNASIERVCKTSEDATEPVYRLKVSAHCVDYIAGNLH